MFTQNDFQDTLNEKSKVQMLLFVGLGWGEQNKTKHTHLYTHTLVRVCLLRMSVERYIKTW